MKNKIVAILLCVALCFSFCSVAFGCDKEPEEVQKDKLMLFLGDSICEGILGPSPLIERENYSYYALVGRRTDGYYYRNRSVSGHQTSNFRAYLTENTDENAMLTQTYIKEADIIAVSIIGNDVLQNQFDEMFIQAIEGSYEILDQRLSDARDNIDAVIKYIKQQNPNATLIVQTLYNPVYSTTPLVREELRKTLKGYGVGAKDLRRLADLVIERMNDVLRDYLVENPGAYYLMDVNGKFDEYFDQDEELGASLIYPDGTHPSNIGHAVIADMYQEYLESTKNKPSSVGKAPPI